MIINANKYNVYLDDNSLSQLNQFLIDNFSNSKIIVLVDENTNEHCWHTLRFHVDVLNDVEIIEVEAGESSKSIDICSQIWSLLSDYKFNRNDLLINLGGGVVSDLGGFVASTYKRGICFINIPTSLLSIVDASIGGKVGIDFNGLKNQIGVFSNPSAVFINRHFLETLPTREFISGYAEIIKHALISDIEYFNLLLTCDFHNHSILNDIILRSIEIKNNIVLQDPKETGLRKILNFGHTIGHAIESFLLNNSICILHGESIAIGICAESYISFKMGRISLDNLNQIVDLILKYFNPIIIDSNNFQLILELMKNDKKNFGNDYSFILLNEIGNASYDHKISSELIIESLYFINNLPNG